MGNTVSTITSKWQITIPEKVRAQIALKIGQRIVWEVEGGALVGRRVRSISELAGCFKSDHHPSPAKTAHEAFAEAALDRHDRISRQNR